MWLDPVFGGLIAICFAVLFASAAVHKWRNLRSFEEAFAAYALLPQIPRLHLIWLIPLCETAVALGLLADATRAAAAIAGAVLLLGYAAAIALNLQRGRRDIDCGCGGPDQRRTIAGWMAWRNLALALSLGIEIWPWSGRVLGWMDVSTIAFGVAAAIVVYLCIDRLGQVAARARALQGSA
jgi:Methylamine utilisation protein MauE